MYLSKQIRGRPSATMWLFPAVAFISLLSAVNAVNYELEGHSTLVSAEDVEGILNQRGHFAPYEDSIRQRLLAVFDGNMQDFYIDYFEIHGDVGRTKSAIFHGYISTTKSRAEVVDTIASTDDTTFFFLSKVEVIPPPPPSQSSEPARAAATSCQNGGILLPNSTCACPSFFHGVDCGIVECLHHGVVDGNQCACPPGVYAMNCQSRGCSPSIEQNLDTSQMSFVLVINQKASMAYALNEIIAKMSVVIADINKGTPIQNYFLLKYIDTKTSTYMSFSYDSTAEGFLKDLAGIVAVDGLPEQQTTRAIHMAESFSALLNPFSNILVFTDAPDSEATSVNYKYSSGTLEMDAIMHAIAWRHRIIMFIIQTDSQQIDTFGDYYDVYRRMTKASIGDLVVVDMLEIDQILAGVVYYYQKIETVAARYNVASTTAVTIPVVTLGPQQHYHAVITVEPNGTLPAITDNKGNAVKGEVTGKRFLLIRGWTSIVPSLTFNGGTAWSCRIFVQSIDTAIVAYDSNPDIDVGSDSSNAELTNEVSTAVIIGFNGTALLSTFDLTTGTTISGALASQTRPTECSFPLLYPARGAACTPGPYGHLFKFTLAGGQHAQRVVPGFCGVLDHHDPVPFNCLNGGTKAGARTCRCTSSYTGINCGTPACQNGGTPDKFPGNGRGLCICPFGYSGDFCAILTCRTQSGDNFDTSNRTLALVLQNSMSQAQVNSNINSGINILLNLMQGSSAFNEYVLTKFNTVIQNETSVVSTNTYSSASDFQTELSSDLVGYTASDAKSQNSLSALYSTMRQIKNDKSSIFLFVDTPSSTNVRLADIVVYAIEKQLQINIVITAPFNMSGLCMTAENAAVYVKLARQTGGIAVNLCNQHGAYNGDPITQMFIGYGSTHHHVENLNEALSMQSNVSQSIPFVVEDPTAAVYAFVNSDVTEQFSVTLVNNDDPTRTIPLMSTISMPFLGVYSIQPSFLNVKGYVLRVVAAQGSAVGQLVTRVVEKTSLATTLRFSPDPSTDSYAKTTFYASAVSPVIHLSSVLQTPPTVTIKAYDEQGVMKYSSTALTRRSTCRYESFFPDPFICATPFESFVMNIMVQSGNTTIQRAERSFCYLYSSQCLNGGTYLPSSAGGGSCHCAAGYTGPYCETSVCVNGGTPTNFGCQCGTSYTGPQCQYVTCQDWDYMETQDVRAQDFKQIIFVMNINKNQALTNILVSQFIEQFVAQSFLVDFTPNQYTLVVYDDKDVVDVVSSSNSQLFIQKFQNQMKKFTDRVASYVLSGDALLEAYKLNLDPPTIMFLFTGASTKSSYNVLTSLSEQQPGTQVNVIYTPNDSPLVQPGYMMAVPARQSRGRILPITAMSVASLNDAMVSALTENALIHDDASKNCSAGATFLFNVESTVQTLVFDITGFGVSAANSVQMFDGLGNVVPLSPSRTLFADSAALIVTIDPVTVQAPSGQWKVIVTTTSSSCYFQARAKTPLKILPGFTSDQNSDFPKEFLFSEFADKKTGNKSAYMTIRLADSAHGQFGQSVSRVEISETDYDDPWNTTPLLTVAVNPRDVLGCSYQFVSDAWTVDKTAYQKYVVYGTDKSGVTWQRTFFFTTKADDDVTCVSGTRNTFGECQCDMNHIGNYCDQPRCQNGGSTSYGVCVCDNGYYGTYCEKYLPNNSPMTTAAANTVSTTSSVTTSPVASSSTSSSGVTSSSVSTVSSSVAASSTTAAGPTATQSTTNVQTTVVSSTSTGTTGRLVCDPGSTTYFINFFVDDTRFASNAQQTVIEAVGTTANLGGQGTATRFFMGGVDDSYHPATSNITTQAMIDKFFATTNVPGTAKSMDLTTAVNSFLTNYGGYLDTENPPIVVIFMNAMIVGGQPALQTVHDTLVNKNYYPLVVDTSLNMENDLVPVFGALNYNPLFNPQDTATFIMKRACQIKPN